MPINFGSTIINCLKSITNFLIQRCLFSWGANKYFLVTCSVLERITCDIIIIGPEVPFLLILVYYIICNRRYIQSALNQSLLPTTTTIITTNVLKVLGTNESMRVFWDRDYLDSEGTCTTKCTFYMYTFGQYLHAHHRGDVLFMFEA